MTSVSPCLVAAKAGQYRGWLARWSRRRITRSVAGAAQLALITDDDYINIAEYVSSRMP